MINNEDLQVGALRLGGEIAKAVYDSSVRDLQQNIQPRMIKIVFDIIVPLLYDWMSENTHSAKVSEEQLRQAFSFIEHTPPEWIIRRKDINQKIKLDIESQNRDLKPLFSTKTVEGAVMGRIHIQNPKRAVEKAIQEAHLPIIYEDIEKQIKIMATELFECAQTITVPDLHAPVAKLTTR